MRARAASGGAAGSRPASTGRKPISAGIEALHHDVAVGVDADLGGDRHRLRAIASASRSLVVERAGGGQRVVAAGADGGDVVLGLEHVAGAGDDVEVAAVGDDQHRLEVAQVLVGAPVLGELDRGALQLAGRGLELLLQPLEQGEGVGGRAGEAADAPACRPG